jgi:hypothetical protein
MGRNKYAVIRIKGCEDSALVDQRFKYLKLNEADIYIFAHDITEIELIGEINALRDFYEDIVLPQEWPSHLRPGVVCGELCTPGTQCYLGCVYYDKGGCTK